MPPEREELKRWLLKAQHDWSVAKMIVAAGGKETDVAAFHCQQAVEKLLKAFLVQGGVRFEKIHHLGRLLDHCVAVDSEFDSLRTNVEPLTIYAVTFRYPGPANPSPEDVQSALRVVEQTWAFLKQRFPEDVLP